MKVALATMWKYELSLRDAIIEISRLTDDIMISPIYPNPSDVDMRDLVRLKRSLGLNFYWHAPVPNNNVMLDMTLPEGRRILKENIINAHKVESNIVMFHGGKIREDNCLKTFADNLRPLLRFAEDREITLCLENHPSSSSIFHSYEEAKILKSLLPEDNFKFCFDTSHAFMHLRSIEKMICFAERLGKDIGAVHLVDCGSARYDMHEGLPYALLPGQIFFRRFIKAVGGMKGFNKIPIILEIQYPQNNDVVKNVRDAIIMGARLAGEI